MGALLMMLLKQPERPGDSDHLVRKGYGAPAPAAITPAFEERFGCTLQEMYGSTELGNCTGNQWGDRRDRHVRHRDAGLRRRDPRRERPPRAARTSRARSSSARSRRTSWSRSTSATPRRPSTAFRGLWFHTGDRGREDADGRFTFVDRLKDAVRRRGENISSWEVEQVLNDHDGGRGDRRDRRPVRPHRGGGDGSRQAEGGPGARARRRCSTSARTASPTSPCRATCGSWPSCRRTTPSGS